AFVGLLSTPALAQVRVQVTAPSVTFNAPPPLVDIGNGVQVVPGIGQEVFYYDGYYWTRSGDYWFRTKDYRGGWGYVQDKDVPPALLGMPKGKYKHYKHHKESDEEARAREERAREREQQKDDEARAREERAREHAERKEEAREERAREHSQRKEDEERAREERERERR